ncbi:MAG: hypothetical protein V7642_2451, partial [Burkholderiales bacterium]
MKAIGIPAKSSRHGVDSLIDLELAEP